MINLPNPFQSAVEPAAMLSADSAAGPCLTDPTVPAADQFESRFVLDVEAFMNDIEPLPAFLSAPSQSYLKANDLIPVLQVLAGH